MNQWAKVLLASAIVSVSVGVNADTVKDNIFNCNQEIKKGNLEKALDISQLLIKQNPKLADGWACQGKALFSQSEYDKAVPAFNQAIALQSVETERMVLLGQLGNTFLQQNKPQQALEQYELAYALAKKNNVSAYQRVVLNLMGDANTQLSKYDVAKSHYDTAFTLAQNDTERMDVLGRIANMYADSNDFNKAIEYQIKKLLSAERYGSADEKADIQLQLGIFYTQAKNYSQAYKTLNLLLSSAKQFQSDYWQALSHIYLAKLDKLKPDLASADSHIQIAEQLNQNLRDEVIGQEITSLKQAK